jgi:hypothetical protein
MDFHGRHFRLFAVFIAHAFYQKSCFYGTTGGQSVDESAEIGFEFRVLSFEFRQI